ncbi:DNA/RNA nuclease SfsA [bacterium]|nr:DNA/RNA nuclease SfsA [bacterium]
MRFPHPLHPGIIVRRLNRFVVSAIIDGTEIQAHLSSSGRMTGLIAAGRRAWFIPVSGANRKTSHRIVLAEAADGTLVSVDAVLPNRLFREAFTDGRLGICTDYDTITPEVAEGKSRFDFLLTGGNGRCFVEVKSVTLVESGTALFPDAPTLRGTKHVRELTALARHADTACAIVFVVQRGDAARFQPHAAMDPDFAHAVAEARSAGVRVYAYGCEVTLEGVRIQERIPLTG